MGIVAHFLDDDAGMHGFSLDLSQFACESSLTARRWQGKSIIIVSKKRQKIKFDKGLREVHFVFFLGVVVEISELNGVSRNDKHVILITHHERL